MYKKEKLSPATLRSFSLLTQPMADDPNDSEEEFLQQVAEERRLARKLRKKKPTELSWKKVDVDVNQLMLGSKESGFLGLEELDYDTWLEESKQMGLDPERALVAADNVSSLAENSDKYDQQSSDASETVAAPTKREKKSEKSKKKKQNGQEGTKLFEHNFQSYILIVEFCFRC
jgi:hypothetical protein